MFNNKKNRSLIHLNLSRIFDSEPTLEKGHNSYGQSRECWENISTELWNDLEEDLVMENKPEHLEQPYNIEYSLPHTD